MTSVQQKPVNLYNAQELKRVSDEHVAIVAQSLGFVEDTTLDLVRLTLGVAAVAIAGGAFLYERNFGFWETYPYLVVGVPAYFVILFLYTYFARIFAGGAIYVGKRGSNRLEIHTTGEKRSESYKIKAILRNAKGSIIEEKEIKGKYNNWFEVRGFIMYDDFATWVKTAIPAQDKKE